MKPRYIDFDEISFYNFMRGCKPLTATFYEYSEELRVLQNNISNSFEESISKLMTNIKETQKKLNQVKNALTANRNKLQSIKKQYQTPPELPNAPPISASASEEEKKPQLQDMNFNTAKSRQKSKR